MEDRTILDWMATSDLTEQGAIVDDIAGSTHDPLLLMSVRFDADFYQELTLQY